jgi:hypothetical protein
MDLSGEVSRLEFEVLKGQKNLVPVRNALDEAVDKPARTESASRRLLEEITAIKQERATNEHTTVATIGHVNKLKVDLESLAKLLRQRVLASAVIHTDNTPVPVQIKHQKKPGKTKRDRFWVYVGEANSETAVVLADDCEVPLKELLPKYWL